MRFMQDWGYLLDRTYNCTHISAHMFAPDRSSPKSRRIGFIPGLAPCIKHRNTMYVYPSEDPANAEKVIRGLYTFLHLQENAQNTAQLNIKRGKTMRAYVYCTYIL